MSWEEGTPTVPDDTVSMVRSCSDLFILGDVWGVGNNDIVERVHLKFCKIILHVQKKSTPDFMVYEELGRFPLGIYVYVLFHMFIRT